MCDTASTKEACATASAKTLVATVPQKEIAVLADQEEDEEDPEETEDDERQEFLAKTNVKRGRRRATSTVPDRPIHETDIVPVPTVRNMRVLEMPRSGSQFKVRVVDRIALCSLNMYI